MVRAKVGEQEMDDERGLVVQVAHISRGRRI